MQNYQHDFYNDRFVNEFIYPNKKNGYYVEIGACDDVTSSQCYFFEKELKWDGIAVEPQKRFNEIIKNLNVSSARYIPNQTRLKFV